MKSFKVTGAKQLAREGIDKLTSQRLLQDRLSLSILVPTIVINLLTILLLVINLHPTGFAVPVRYSSLSGFEDLGPWYQIYGIGLFAVGTTIVNLMLALTSYPRSRIASFFLLSGSFVVAVFSLIVSLAFAAII